MKRLYREPKYSSDRMVAGVCGGIGNTYNLDPTVVRLVTVLLCLIPPLIVAIAGAYIAGWVIIPEKTAQ